MKYRNGISELIKFTTLVIIAVVALSPLLSPVLSNVVKPYSDGECEECHTGFEPFNVLMDSPTGVKEGEDFEFKVIVINPWVHEIRDLVVEMDLSGAPNIMDPEAGTDEVIESLEQGSIVGGSSASGTIIVTSDISDLTLGLTYRAPVLYNGDARLEVEGPNGGIWTSDQTGTTEELSLSSSDIEEEGPGPYIWTVENEGRFRSIDFSLSIELRRTAGAIIASEPVTLGPMEERTISFTLTTLGKGENTVDVQTRAQAYHDHEENHPDEDLYTEEGSFRIIVGDEYIYSGVDRPISTVTSLWYIGRFMGFFTAGLFTASFLSGGSIRSLKIWLDRRFRKRKDWHCIISITTVVSALVHMIVLYSGVYGGTYKGLGLGLTATLLMVAIGATGILRARIVRGIGDLNWRRLHFWLSWAVIIVFIIHGVTEGTDLAFLRWW